LSGRGLCDELITRPEESYRLCYVVVCDLETSRTGAPYIYNVRLLRVKKHCSITLSKYVSSLGPKSIFFVDDNDLLLYSKDKFVSVSAELSGLKGLAFLLTEKESNRKMEEYAQMCHKRAANPIILIDSSNGSLTRKLKNEKSIIHL